MRELEERQESAEAISESLDHYICPDRPSTRSFCGTDLRDAGDVIYDAEINAKTCSMCILEFEHANYHCVLCGLPMDAHAAH